MTFLGSLPTCCLKGVLFWPEARRFQVDHVAWEPRGPSMGVTSMLSHLAFSCVLRITLKPQQALLSGLPLQPFSFLFLQW